MHGVAWLRHHPRDTYGDGNQQVSAFKLQPFEKKLPITTVIPGFEQSSRLPESESRSLRLGAQILLLCLAARGRYKCCASLYSTRDLLTNVFVVQNLLSLNFD